MGKGFCNIIIVVFEMNEKFLLMLSIVNIVLSSCFLILNQRCKKRLREVPEVKTQAFLFCSLDRVPGI
ncbi:hypothetical protein VNO78_11310 [Psophocarpus tetragonolobus]|uniref:Uncharacterized protein n=1 Tax=Psophocarpus tetragonolobus TaxID=3891 RepID=A0AAN9SNQ6_PSOTE